MNQQGFTFIELIIVLVIISSILFGSYYTFKKRQFTAQMHLLSNYIDAVHDASKYYYRANCYRSENDPLNYTTLKNYGLSSNLSGIDIITDFSVEYRDPNIRITMQIKDGYEIDILNIGATRLVGDTLEIDRLITASNRLTVHGTVFKQFYSAECVS